MNANLLLLIISLSLTGCTKCSESAPVTLAKQIAVQVSQNTSDTEVLDHMNETATKPRGEEISTNAPPPSESLWTALKAGQDSAVQKALSKDINVNATTRFQIATKEVLDKKDSANWLKAYLKYHQLLGTAFYPKSPYLCDNTDLDSSLHRGIPPQNIFRVADKTEKPIDRHRQRAGGAREITVQDGFAPRRGHALAYLGDAV